MSAQAINYLFGLMRQYRNELILLVFSFGWAIFVSFTIQLKPEFSIIGDDWSYWNAALTLYFEGLPDEGRPFGIAAIYGLPLLLTDAADWVIGWGLVVNMFCWLFSGIVVYRILLARFNDEFKAFVYAIFSILCLGNLAIAFRFLPEPIFILLLLLAVTFISKFELTRKPKYLSLALATLLFAVMIKPVALGMAILVATYHYKSLLFVVKHKSSVLIYAMVILIGVQMNEMKKAYGDYKISYIGNITYYNYLGAKADCYRKNIAFVPGENKRAKYFQSFSSHDQQKLVRADIAEQLQNNTLNLARAYLYCLYSNSSKGSFIISNSQNKDFTLYFDVCHFGFKALSKLQNILLTAIGIILSVYCWVRRRQRSDFVKILAVITLYVFFVSGMSCFQTDRFHIVFFPLVIMMAAELRHKNTSGLESSY
jgi:hypothetical protein